jgi:hypothetical protein
MSMSTASPPGSAKTDLETVTRWPLLVTAAGVGFLLLGVPVVLACVAALKGDAAKDKVAVRTPPAIAEPVNVAPVATPARHVASYVPPTERATTPPVHVAPSRPPLKPVPVRKTAPVAVAPRPLDPVLQFPDVEPPKPPPFKRHDLRSEDSLHYDLRVQEVDLESVKGTREKLLVPSLESVPDSMKPLAQGRVLKPDTKNTPTILTLRAERADLKGLPFQEGASCQVSTDVAKKREALAKAVRGFHLSAGRAVSYHESYGTTELATHLGAYAKECPEDGLSTVVQMLQVGDLSVRWELIRWLAIVKSAKGSEFLARQALFDLSAASREEAVKLLKGRPCEEYRQVLLDGLRYPWAPVASHAAEALVALDDREAIYNLAAVLDEPNPCAPVLDKDNKWVVREVVRVNHLRNCQLCHAPSTDSKDPLRGAVPTPGKPLPLRVYYAEGSSGFVRADITYLRQDFSLLERVAKPDNWPEWQRFDYLVRTRELTADERAVLDKKPRKSKPVSYPQREAVLFALRELTGLDAGEESADWYELLN